MRDSGCDVIIKIVTLFLIAMGVLAMFGKLRFPGQKRLSSAKCRKCGRFRIGKGPCPCEKGGRG
ncbi:hypothetical protein [Ruegeria sp.]|uniref:hypothetical protein n=1 Tax=Ruegeria sp. TaxID=1879320 RepID=UPI002312AACF|nr:hypothetical protein [Ruegeria sp.]MDA7965413.1 hypothetical protein [Ruegeria sp.]